MCFDAKNCRERARGSIMRSFSQSASIVVPLTASTSFSLPSPLLYNHLFVRVSPR